MYIHKVILLISILFGINSNLNAVVAGQDVLKYQMTVIDVKDGGAEFIKIQANKYPYDSCYLFVESRKILYYTARSCKQYKKEKTYSTFCTSEGTVCKTEKEILDYIDMRHNKGLKGSCSDWTDPESGEYIIWYGGCGTGQHPKGKGTMFYTSTVTGKIYKIYKGNIKNGKYNGYGTLLYDNGYSKKKYIGTWKNGLKHGEMVIIKNGKEGYATYNYGKLIQNTNYMKVKKTSLNKGAVLSALGVAAIVGAVMSIDDSPSSSSSSSSYSSSSSSYDARCYSRCKSNKNNVEASCQGLSREYIDFLSTSTYYSACMRKARTAYKECERSCF